MTMSFDFNYFDLFVIFWFPSVCSELFFPQNLLRKKKKNAFVFLPVFFCLLGIDLLSAEKNKNIHIKVGSFWWKGKEKKHITTQFCEKRILDAGPLYSYAYSDIGYIQIWVLFYFYFCLEKKKFNCYTRPAPPLWRFQMRLHLSYLLLLIFYETNINKKHKNKPIHVQ